MFYRMKLQLKTNKTLTIEKKRPKNYHDTFLFTNREFNLDLNACFKFINIMVSFQVLIIN